MQPERLPEAGADVYLVIQWKTELDSDAPRWQQWFFKYIYIPFQRFAFKWFKIPRSKQVMVEADKDGRTYTTFSWFENGGAYPTAEQAEAACMEPGDGYKPIPWGRCAPRDSAEYGRVVFPRSNKPARWAKPTLSLVIKDRQADEQERATLAQCLQALNQELDRR